MKNFRAPAVPLIIVDPYFSIWSFADNLYDDSPRHWTGKKNALTGLVKIDGEWKRFMGKVENDSEIYYTEPDIITQKSVKVLPLTTEYEFADDRVTLKLYFMTPLLPDDLSLLSRPVSYISYEIASNDGKEHEIEIYFDISSEACVNTSEQSAVFEKNLTGLRCACKDSDMLSTSGDNLRIDWGWLYLFGDGYENVILDTDAKKYFLSTGKYRELETRKKLKVRDGYPSLCAVKRFKIDGNIPYSDFICVGYDDIKSIEYFGKKIDAYWRKDGEDFADIALKARKDYKNIVARADKFNDGLVKRASAVSPEYSDIVSLAYRQVIAAHKLTWDGEELQFLSKECFSNGCIGTVDVSYPSIPLFLIYNPQLVFGMLNPIFKFVNSGKWEYDFAPHDVGQYPLANGQVYGFAERYSGKLPIDYQMPVEECGNMLICVVAACKALENFDYAKKHIKILKQWADYLVSKDFDPENQLCTDDFAGHLAHNCNLSVKGIIGIACFGSILKETGNPEEAKVYLETAKAFAEKWKKAAFDKDHYRLAFDREESWSIKYNLVWDKIFGLGLFDEDIFETEINYYKTKINEYGLPLDSRSDYTKSDWQMWSAKLTDDKEFADMIINAMYKMLCDTKQRVPFTDWYYTSNASQVGFQNRTVQGGLFILMM